MFLCFRHSWPPKTYFWAILLSYFSVLGALGGCGLFPAIPLQGLHDSLESLKKDSKKAKKGKASQATEERGSLWQVSVPQALREDVMKLCKTPTIIATPPYWKSKFLYRYRPEGSFRIFFGLILDPPGTYAFTAKKGKFICTGHFFPHGMAFLEKRGGLVPVYVFIFPAVGPWIWVYLSFWHFFWFSSIL